MNTALFEAEKYDRKGYSQFGESGILEELVRRLNRDSGSWKSAAAMVPRTTHATSSKRAGAVCGTNADRENVGKAWVLNALTFLQLVQPDTFVPIVNPPIGVLSIDVDGNDYWLWKGLGPKLDASIVVIELPDTA